MLPCRIPSCVPQASWSVPSHSRTFPTLSPSLPLPYRSIHSTHDCRSLLPMLSALSGDVSIGNDSGGGGKRTLFVPADSSDPLPLLSQIQIQIQIQRLKPPQTPFSGCLACLISIDASYSLPQRHFPRGGSYRKCVFRFSPLVPRTSSSIRHPYRLVHPILLSHIPRITSRPPTLPKSSHIQSIKQTPTLARPSFYRTAKAPGCMTSKAESISTSPLVLP